MSKILIADDDYALCQLLKEYLQNEAFDVDCVHTGKQAVEAAINGTYHLLILDVMLPELMGFDVLKKLREHSSIPILMLTARGDDIDRIIGLELGADDYLPKPCNPRELLARLRAILRRCETDVRRDRKHTLDLVGITLNRASRSACFHNITLDLTSAEFAILDILMQSAGTLVSKETLTEKALGRRLTAYDRSVDVHISKIRKKLHAVDPKADLIANIRGAGYQFVGAE